MRRLLKWIEAALAAVAFAEEGDVETARRIVAEAGEGEAPPDTAGGAVPARRRPRWRRLARNERVARSS